MRKKMKGEVERRAKDRRGRRRETEGQEIRKGEGGRRWRQGQKRPWREKHSGEGR